VRFASVRRRLPELSWVQLSLLWGAVLSVAWSLWYAEGLQARLIHDGLLYLVGPLLLGLAYGRNLGWRVDRRAIRNTVYLSLFVLPFYLVGSSLPSIRAYYPMWSTSAALGEFLPHAVMQFALALAAETYYRGLLCVGVRDLGFKAVFISPVVYAIHHLTKPPIEWLLSAPTDVLFGAVDYRSNSILPSVVAHGLGLTLLDWLVLHDPLLAPETVAGWLSWLPIGL
jgi:hypothetical protein